MSTKKQGGGSRRDNYLRRKYGIDESVYREMLKDQDGKCAVCHRPPRAGKNLHVDHDHADSSVNPNTVNPACGGTCAVNTEVKMVPAIKYAAFPAWDASADQRAGGVPDPATAGPPW